MKTWERALFGLSALAMLGAIGVKLHELDMPVARFVRSFNIDEVNYSGDLVGVLGKGLVLTAVFIVIGLLGWRLKRELWKNIGLRGVLTMAAVGAVSQSIKHLLGRPRPRFAHADEFVVGPSFASGMDSFPSGHTINIFGAAMVVVWFLPALRIPLLLIAGLVGLSRVVRGSHFPTDVYAGAVLGILIGSLVAAGYKRWRDDALPGLLRTGVPIIVAVFLISWIVLHPVTPWPREMFHLEAGVVLVLVGGLLRATPLRAAGPCLMILGVAVACGPWWGGLMLAVSLVPLMLQAKPPAAMAVVLPDWGRGSLAVGAALVAIAVIRSVKGLLPLG